MTFLNFDFLIIFLVFYVGYVFVHYLKINKVVYISITSLMIYAIWYPPSVLILLASITVTYITSILLDKNKKYRLLIFICGVFLNLTILFYFKYIDFYFKVFFNSSGAKNLILPLGISFYILTSIAFISDRYKKITEKRSFINIVYLISFWPHLAAGPILRAKDVFKRTCKKTFVRSNVFITSLILIIGGASKKLFIGDNLGAYVNQNIMYGIKNMDALSAFLTIFGFGGQIYADFSGYSEMALGFSLLLGVRLPANFNYPYQATSFSGFWRRWHISLSQWFRDYIYIPLGGNRKNPVYTYLIIMLVFTVSGVWHGANINFIIWGSMHGVLLVFEKFIKFKQWNIHKLFKLLIVIFTVNYLWVFFRFNFSDAMLLTNKILSFTSWQQSSLDTVYFNIPIVFFLLVIIIDHVFKYYTVNKSGEWELFRFRNSMQTYIYICMILTLALWFRGNPLPFIYFDF